MGPVENRLLPVTTLLYLLAAGMAFHAGITHLVVGNTRRPRDRVHLSFAALAFAVGATTVATWVLHTTTTRSTYIAVFRGPWFVSAAIVVVAFAWFVAYWTDVRPVPVLLVFTVATVVVVAANLWAPQGLILRGVTQLREVRFPFGEAMTLHVAVEGPSPLVPLINLALAGFIAFALYHEVRRRGIARAAPLLSAIGLLAVATTYDAFVDAGTIRTPYTLPLAAVGVVGLMSWRLGGEVRRDERTLARHADELRAVVDRRTVELRAANAALSRRVDQLGSLRRIAHISPPPGRLQAALADILAILAPLVDADAAACSIEPWHDAEAITGTWVPADVGQDAASQLRRALRTDADATAGSLHETRVPLTPGGEVEGTLVVLRGEGHLTTADHGLIETVAADVATLVLRDRLLRALHDAAAAEERRRISRELHESVTQTLYSVTMVAEALPRTYEADPVTGRRALEQLRELSLGALAELRELLLELRPESLKGTSLQMIVQDQADGLTTRTQIPVDLTINGAFAPSDEVKVVLRRVVRELLSNIARHANATVVGLHVQADVDGCAAIEVIDDGDGFDPEVVGPDHHGLVIARERLASVGGFLQLSSRLGEGTQALVRWPTARTENLDTPAPGAGAIPPAGAAQGGRAGQG